MTSTLDLVSIFRLRQIVLCVMCGFQHVLRKAHTWMQELGIRGNSDRHVLFAPTACCFLWVAKIQGEAQCLDELQDLFSRAQGKSLQGEENCGTPMAQKYQEMKLMEHAEQGEVNNASDSSKAPREIHPLPGGLHWNGGIRKKERRDLFKLRILDSTCDPLEEQPLERDLRVAKNTSCFRGPWVFDALHESLVLASALMKWRCISDSCKCTIHAIHTRMHLSLYVYIYVYIYIYNFIYIQKHRYSLTIGAGQSLTLDFFLPPLHQTSLGSNPLLSRNRQIPAGVKPIGPRWRAPMKIHRPSSRPRGWKQAKEDCGQILFSRHPLKTHF